MAHQETSRGDWAASVAQPLIPVPPPAGRWPGPIVSIQCNLEGRGLTAPPVSPVGAICLREHPLPLLSGNHYWHRSAQAQQGWASADAHINQR